MKKKTKEEHRKEKNVPEKNISKNKKKSFFGYKAGVNQV